MLNSSLDDHFSAFVARKPGNVHRATLNCGRTPVQDCIHLCMDDKILEADWNMSRMSITFGEWNQVVLLVSWKSVTTDADYVVVPDYDSARLMVTWIYSAARRKYSLGFCTGDPHQEYK